MVETTNKEALKATPAAQLAGDVPMKGGYGRNTFGGQLEVAVNDLLELGLTEEQAYLVNEALQASYQLGRCGFHN